MSVLGQLKPAALWRHFEKLCEIPHPSKHEEKIGKYLADFGRSIGVETIQDEVGNVILRKPATAGMADRPWVCLQAHMDMVPQKNADVQHDFLKDPIRPKVDGKVVRACGTTLGADNGIGVAAIMAVFEAKDIVHGPLEALITVDEEAGMTGAKGLKPGLLRSSIMINVDSENEDELCVGCAGGMDTSVRAVAPEEALPAGFAGFAVRVHGLRGGHSGIDIHLGRGNSNILLARLLWEAAGNMDLRLASFEGGDLRNVIPRDTRAVVAVPAKDADRFKKHVGDMAATFKAEFSSADPDISVEVSPLPAPPAKAVRAGDGKRLLAAIFSAPNGVSYMCADMPGLTETSSNLAAVRIGGGAMSILSLQRSAQDSRKYELGSQLKAHFELAGLEVSSGNGYSGWKPNPKSPMVKHLAAVYRRVYGGDPKISATHGGLECGILLGSYPGMDAISIGANLHFPHSPDEHVEIDSVGRAWDYLLEVLKTIPKA
ncbi:MAG: aminoacyl-histidine dipeptidase [Elusimicrobiota bacterium]|jgi:dipeptidase D